MIIYFDFNLCQIKFIQQQNSYDSFAVDFLMEKATKKDFAGIIDDFCTANKELLPNLQLEKNYVVLPDKVVGFDSLQVPTVRFGKNKFFQDKFNLIYNRDGNYLAESNILTKNSKTTTFIFTIVKKDIISQIVDTFKKFGVTISGISYFSKVLTDYLFYKNSHVSKQNVFVTIYDKEIYMLALSNGNIIAAQQTEKKKNNLAKKYASFVKNKENSLKIYENNVEREIYRTKIDRDENAEKIEKTQIILDKFKENVEKNSLIKFNKNCIVNSKDKFVGLDEPNIIVIDEFSEEKALSKYKSNPFYIAKRSFWKWEKKV